MLEMEIISVRESRSTLSLFVTYRNHPISNIALKIVNPPTAPAMASRTLLRLIRPRPWRASSIRSPRL